MFIWYLDFHYNCPVLVPSSSYCINRTAAFLLSFSILTGPAVLYCAVLYFAVLYVLCVALSRAVLCFELKVVLPCLADRFPGRTLRLWSFPDVLESQPHERSPLDLVSSFNACLVFLSRSPLSFLRCLIKNKIGIVVLPAGNYIKVRCSTGKWFLRSWIISFSAW